MNEKELRDLVFEILPKGHLMSLATLDDGGPWVSDVVYIYTDDLKLYWMSDPDARHSKSVLNEPRVAATITISNKSKESNEGLQISGRAQKLEGKRHDLAKLHWQKRQKPAPSEEEDYLDGDSWYEFIPEKIDIICERLWGYDKKSIVTKL